MSGLYTNWSAPTKYKGVQFASRLEARWALFFDALAIRWQYEPQKFALEAGGYVPDFRLSWPNGLALWAEVKPTMDVVRVHDLKRYAQFSKQRTLVLLVGLPEPKAYSRAAAPWDEIGVILLPHGPHAALIDGGAALHDLTAITQACDLATQAKFKRKRT